MWSRQATRIRADAPSAMPESDNPARQTKSLRADSRTAVGRPLPVLLGNPASPELPVASKSRVLRSIVRSAICAHIAPGLGSYVPPGLAPQIEFAARVIDQLESCVFGSGVD